MNKKLIPDTMIQKYDRLDVEKLKEHGIDTLIIDIDNTLVEYLQVEPTKQVIEWVDYIKASGFKVALVSNAKKQRALEFSRNLDVFCVYKAGKPKKAGIKKALSHLQSTPSKSALLGDQIFTDVLAAKRMGMLSILVKRISERETFLCKAKRVLERRVFKKMGTLRLDCEIGDGPN